MTTDQYGLELTTDSNAAAQAYVEGLDLLLARRSEAGDRFVAALEHDPEFALARSAVAFLGQYSSNLSAAVGQALAASAHAARATRREQQHAAVIRRALTRDWTAAERLARTHLEEFPRDALIVWEWIVVVGHGGTPDRKARVATGLEPLAPEFGDDPWFLGTQTMVMCETRQLATAERLVERGLASRPDHAGLAHGRAHVYFEQGDDRAGRTYLREWLPSYGHAVASAGHLYWHLGVVELALRDPTAALGLYREVQMGTPRFRLEDAASLLWRLHLRGADVSDDLQGLAGREPSTGITSTFESAHRALVLAGLGDRSGLEVLGRAVPPVAPLAMGLGALVAGRWADAVAPLAAAAASAPDLGGSNEQHTVFYETLATAYRRAGREGEARDVENGLLAGRAVVPVAAPASAC